MRIMIIITVYFFFGNSWCQDAVSTGEKETESIHAMSSEVNIPSAYLLVGEGFR